MVWCATGWPVFSLALSKGTNDARQSNSESRGSASALTTHGRAPMAQNERTSDRIAMIAARGAFDPASLTLEEIQEVCASALTQAPDHEDEPQQPSGAHSVYK
jgi:hypothetical protein